MDVKNVLTPVRWVKVYIKSLRSQEQTLPWGLVYTLKWHKKASRLA